MIQERQARRAAEVGAVLGEGPVWVAREQALYWLDIKGLKVFRLDGPGQVREWQAPFRIGSIAPRRDGGFIAGTERGFASVDLDGGRFEPFANPEPDRPTNRFNDGKVDRGGRFWAGTMDDTEREASGALYRLDHDLSWSRADGDYRVTNGPAFSVSGRLMYHNDSGRRLTYVFDLDESGRASNRRIFARYGEGDGYPDGMTVDSEDCLWIAFWDGWCVRRFSPAGECIATIDLPVQKPTSCAFGGSDLNLLFITSASIGLTDSQRSEQPCAGDLFMLDSCCTGLADLPFEG
ncbi:MAG TPA: SMP-30/gluconolactonase/LRE family protein [Sphingomicrobium sp.]|nr:SMP-30/gluconolactonase/LRE family protein [Sphingomicrobium sp.]